MRQIFPAFLFAALVAGGCSKPGSTVPPAPQATVILPEAREVMEYEDLPGRVEALDQVEIKARVTGVLTKVQFQEGAEVIKGDLLYLIDPREYQAEYDEATSAWQQADARLAQARSDYERAQLLSKSTVIAKQELENKGTEVRAAEALVRSAQAAVNKSQLNLEYTQIKAPIAGKISRTNVTEGNLVQNGDTLTSVVSQDPVYVYLEAPERVVLRWDKLVKTGSLGTKALVNVGLPNEDGFPRKGEVDFTDNELNPGTGTLRVRAILPNPDRSLRVGFYARVRLSLDQPNQSLLVPERAVGVDQGQRFVYIVNPENKVEYRKVTVGQIYDGKLAVLDGLRPDDRIVSDGIQLLHPGQTVNPVMPAETAEAAPSPANNEARN